MVEEIRYIDYRYYRFLLHPEGEFRMVRCVHFCTLATALGETNDDWLPQGMERSELEDDEFTSTGFIIVGSVITHYLIRVECHRSR